jgi:hypothetical protein
MPEKVLFCKSVELVPRRKGLFKDPMLDVDGFSLLVVPAVIEKGLNTKPRKQRNWGDDDEYDLVMQNFGLTPGKPGEPIEQQLVFGWANVTVQEDGSTPFDWQGDITSTEMMESAAYDFVLQHGLANQEHNWGSECGWFVESMMFTKDKMQALGIPEGLVPEGWFVGFYIPDPVVYQKVKDGEYNMFSIEGTATRVPLGTGLPV